jgi:hypothetical protein
VPELWNPLTGEVRRQIIYEERDGRTVLPLWLEPAGSIFVVFRADSARTRANHVVEVRRNEQDVLPSVGRNRHEPPPLELGGRGAGTVLAWQPGVYALKTAAGRNYSVSVDPLPEALELRGPWQVFFPPNHGAPERVTFDHLTSWSDHGDPGIKYFSGTASYRKTFELPEGSVTKSRRLFLDLGRVEVIAHAILNGKDLGTLWKPPFRADITSALKSGPNSLEVKVVNLWVNRQIGDEQLPEDSDRNVDGTLKQWPQWVLDGKPSPTGRYGFTSWRLWKKRDALVESGLIGPVRVVAAEARDLK